MNNILRVSITLLLYTISLLLPGCKKYIDTPTSSTTNTINSLEKCERLLNNTEQLNTFPMSSEISADDYTLTYTTWQSAPRVEQLLHIWATDIFEGKRTFSDYSEPYETVYLANEVIRAIGSLTILPGQLQQRNYLLGAALFHRGTAFFNLLQLFARPYEAITAGTDTGICLQLSVDNTTDFKRSSMKESYDQVILDLKTAATLLPAHSPATVSRHKPSHMACQAMLARVFLTMRDYTQAQLYADSCLSSNGSLLDYNVCSEQWPFKESNPEIIYQACLSDTYTLILTTRDTAYSLDTVLYRSYGQNDLRQRLFFSLTTDRRPVLKSAYTGSLFFFAGLATDEMYLIRSECNARKGLIPAAMNDLNKLLIHRYKQNFYTARTATTISEALTQILTERRKELVFRGLRWQDLRRLGMEGSQDTIYRNIAGIRYTLPPKDLRYTLPIPPNGLAGGTVQNPR